MTLALPHASHTLWETNLPATPSLSVYGTTVTASGTHTKGSYSPLIDPVDFDVVGFWLWVGETGAAVTDTGVLVDIAIGPSGGGSEQVIIPNWMAGWRRTNAAAAVAPSQVFLPIAIPKGVRVSARCQSVVSGDTVIVGIALVGGASGLLWPTYAGVDAFGIDTADSGGTLHTAGSSGAESAWATIGSVTTRHYFGAIMLPQRNNDTSLTNSAFHWEVGYTPSGGGGTDVTLGEWLWFSGTGEEWFGPYPATVALAPIPSGSNMRIRGECGGTPEACDVAIYCLY